MRIIPFKSFIYEELIPPSSEEEDENYDLRWMMNGNIAVFQRQLLLQLLNVL